MIEGSNQKSRLLGYGNIVSSPKDDLSQRLAHIYRSLEAICNEHLPQAVAVEEIYMNKNVSSALPVAHARGCVLLLAGLRKLPVHEYSALSIKKAVVGTGQANKAQVQQMTAMLLGMAKAASPDHAADALAAALCLQFYQSFAQLAQIPSPK